MLALAGASTAFGHRKGNRYIDSTGPPAGAIRIDRVKPSTSPIMPIALRADEMVGHHPETTGRNIWSIYYLYSYLHDGS
jgi:hypothetical protein